MATSGTRTFILTRDNIIEEAYRLIGVLGLGDSADATMKSEAQQTLNIWVQELQNDGIYLWEQTIDYVAMVSATASYTLDADTLEAKDFHWRNTSGIDTKLELMTLAEYQDLTDKDQAGDPQKVWVDYQLAAPVAYPWPVKETCTTETLRWTKIARLQDFSAAADNPDFPTRWYKAIVYGLAADMAPVWGKIDTTGYERIVSIAGNLRQNAKDGGPRTGDLQFTVRIK